MLVEEPPGHGDAMTDQELLAVMGEELQQAGYVILSRAEVEEIRRLLKVQWAIKIPTDWSNDRIATLATLRNALAGVR